MVDTPDLTFWETRSSFDSLADFETAQKEYQEANYCLFVKGRTELLPNDTKFKYQSLMLKCKQYGEPRINEKVTGQRPRQKTYATGCEAYLQLTFSRKKCKMMLVKYHLVHNHPCNSVTYYGYPEIRSLNTSQVEKTKAYSKAKVIPSIVRPILKDIGSNPSQIILARDISNVKTKERMSERQGRSDEEMLQAKLKQIQDKDKDAHLKIQVDDKDNVQYVFIQTSEMRGLYQKFPEVLVMDLTYKINRNAMPVLVVEVMDGDGIGEPVAYGFVANELKETLCDILQELILSCGNSVAQKTKVVVIDKDFSEIAALQATFPHAQIILCSVHVENRFKTYVASEPKAKKEVVLESLKGMLNSGSEDEFVKHYKTFAASATQGLKDKFDRNWLTNKTLWSLKDKTLVLSLRNHTTNRVESHNQKLKLYLSSNTPLYEAISDIVNIVLSNRKDERLYRQHERLTKKVVINKCSDPVINEISNDLTEYASKIVLQQLCIMKRDPEDCSSVKVTESSCNCELFVNLGLQCRHIMWCRKKAGISVYSKDVSLRRWHQAFQLEGPLRDNVEMVHSARMPGGPVKKVVTPRDKYKEVVPLTQKLNTHVTSCGSQMSKQFYQRLQVLKDLDRNWSNGMEVIVVPLLQEKNCRDQVPGRSPVTFNDGGNDTIVLPKIPIRGRPSGQHATLHGNRKYSSKKPLEKTATNNTVKEENVKCRVCDRDVSSSLVCEKCKHPVHPTVCARIIKNNTGLLCHLCDDCESDSSNKSEAAEDTVVISSDDGSDLSNHLSTSVTKNGTISHSQIINSDDESSTSSNTSLLGKKQQIGESVTHPLSPVNPSVEESHNKEKKNAPFKLNIVSTKGRPKVTKGKKTKWTVRNLLEDGDNEFMFDTPDAPDDGRLQRGLKIKDTDITVKEYGWLVKSQTSTGKPYKILKVLDSCTECVCDPCIHVLLCECTDHVKRSLPCKHIFKVADFVNRKGVCAQSASEVPSSAGNQDNVPSRHCPVCAKYGQPTKENAAHHCLTCGGGVHNFGCSIEVAGGEEEEGFGSRNRQCWECYDKGKAVSNSDEQMTAHSQNPEHASQSILNGTPPFRNPYCPGCGKLVEGRVCQGTVNPQDRGRIFYKCFSGRTAKCRSLFLWEPNNVRKYRDSQENTSAEPHHVNEESNRSPALTEDDNNLLDLLSLLASENDENDVKPPLQPAICTPGEVVDLTLSEDENQHDPDADKALLPWDIHSFRFPNWSELGAYYSCMDVSFSKGALESLREGEFLDDKIIDAFSDVVTHETCDNFVEIHYVDSCSIGVTTIGITGFIERASESTDFFNDVWIVPSNVDFNHWILFVVFIREKKIVVLDPLYRERENFLPPKVVEHLKVLRYYLNQSYMHCLDGEQIDWEEWNIHAPMDFPRQSNGFDCGVIVCLFIYSLCCGKMLSPETFTEEGLLHVRKFISHKILSQSTRMPERTPSKSSTPPDPDMAQSLYHEVTAQIISGERVVDKVWDKNKSFIRVNYTSPVPGRSTLEVIANYVANHFKATEEFCGIPSGCRMSGVNRMFLCELCREYFHLDCAGDKRPTPQDSEDDTPPYLCPVHIKGKTRSRRGIKKPIRLRVSIGEAVQ